MGCRAARPAVLADDLDYTPQDLDRSVVVPDQIRTILSAYRDAVSTELFPDRTLIPKTLIFAKDDSHAEDIVHICREVFGKGNDFCKKITYQAKHPVTGKPAKSKKLIREFCLSPTLRIAVTVSSMPLASAKATKPNPGHWIASRLCRLNRCCSELSFRPVATKTTLAARLARLDRKLDAPQREQIVAASGGQTPATFAGALLRAFDPDAIAERATGRPGAEPQEVAPEDFKTVQQQLIDAATGPKSTELRTTSEKSMLELSLPELAKAFPLPWSHYVLLISRSRSPEAFQFYQAGAIRGGRLVRQFQRQIDSQFYERTALSCNKASVTNRR